VKTLEFEEEPDYVWIKRLFKDLFSQSGFVDNNIMDWAERHKY
jgi:casein kinase 1